MPDLFAKRIASYFIEAGLPGEVFYFDDVVCHRFTRIDMSA